MNGCKKAKQFFFFKAEHKKYVGKKEKKKKRLKETKQKPYTQKHVASKTNGNDL